VNDNLLHVPAGSPWWLFAAAYLILFLHIAGGSAGIISGFVALLSRKGGRVHRVAGTVFFISMLVMATIGASASPFLPKPEMPNVFAGILVIYLIATSWVAIRRKNGSIGRLEFVGLIVALGVVASGAMFAKIASNSPTGTIGNTPPQAFYVFMIVGAIGAAGDLLPRPAENHARLHARITMAVRAGVRATAVDGLLADPRSGWESVQESPDCDARKPIRARGRDRMNMFLTAGITSFAVERRLHSSPPWRGRST
jgi:uncharacterized membrane protein